MTRTLLTYADYAALPENGQRHEIHDGELSVTPAPTPRRTASIGSVAGVWTAGRRWPWSPVSVHARE